MKQVVSQQHLLKDGYDMTDLNNLKHLKTMGYYETRLFKMTFVERWNIMRHLYMTSFKK